MTKDPTRIAAFFKWTCQRCGVPIEQKHGGQSGKRLYCDACRTVVLHEKQLQTRIRNRNQTLPGPRPCKRCGAIMTPLPGQVYCIKKYCDACALPHRNEDAAMRREKYRQQMGLDKPLIRPCARCGKEMSLIGRERQRKYCRECAYNHKTEVQAQDRAYSRQAAGLPETVVKTCVRCGKEMTLERKPGLNSVKYCAECRPVAYKSSSHGLHTLKAAPVYLITCCDCGKEVLALFKSQVRCKDCASVNNQIYFAMRALRGAIANRTIVDPAGAKQFVVDMIAEDGLNFKNFAIDGIVERVIIDKRKVKEYLDAGGQEGWSDEDEEQTKPDKEAT